MTSGLVSTNAGHEIWIPNLLGSTINPLELAWLTMAIITTIYTQRIHLRAARAHARVMDKTPDNARLHQAADHALSCVYSSFVTQGFAMVLGLAASIAPNQNQYITLGSIIPIVCIMGMEAVLMYEAIHHLRYIEKMERES